jgi:hypothetical protein
VPIERTDYSHDADLHVECLARNIESYVLRSCDPLFDRIANIAQGFLACLTLAHASRKAGDFDNPTTRFLIWIQNNLSHLGSVPRLNRRSSGVR